MVDKVTTAVEYGKVDYPNIDSRQLKKFMQTPSFSQSLSTVERGKMEKRIDTATWSKDERIVYDAVIDGYTSLDTLPVATGLTDTQVRKAVASLASRGRVSSISVTAQPVQM